MDDFIVDDGDEGGLAAGMREFYNGSGEFDRDRRGPNWVVDGRRYFECVIVHLEGMQTLGANPPFALSCLQEGTPASSTTTSHVVGRRRGPPQEVPKRPKSDAPAPDHQQR